MIDRYDLLHMAAHDPEPVPWIVDELLADSALTLLYGPGGIGKSMLSLALALAVPNGAAVAGLRCHPGAHVTYLDGENGPAEFHRRLRGLLSAETASVAGVTAYGVTGWDLRTDRWELEDRIQGDETDVLIIDSFRTMAPGLDENDSAQVAEVLVPLARLARKHRVAILILHHANKGRQQWRGSSAFVDLVDIAVELGADPDDPDRSRRCLRWHKMRLGGEPPPRWIKLNAERGSVEIDVADPFASTGTTVVTDELAQPIIDALGDRPLTLAEVARAVGRDPKDGSVRRALRMLEARSSVCREDGCWTVPGATPKGDGTLAPDSDQERSAA